MTSRERVFRTLEFRNPDRAPRDLWALPGVGMMRRDELDEMVRRFPSDFGSPSVRYGESSRRSGTHGAKGVYIDEWGTQWVVAEDGVCGEVKHPQLADWNALAAFQPPWELLDGADFSQTNRSCAESDRFMKAGTGVRPFERMQFLRGSENLFLDLMCQPREFLLLRDMIHDFERRELELWARTDVDAVGFMDDWGTQHSLLIDPELWRDVFKPMYREYCRIVKGAGKRVFFHSDGHTEAIIDDLIEIGVDAVNTQIFCMDIESLAQRFKGRITFWGEICRQHILPFGSVEDVRAAVRRVRRAFDDGSGGLIAQCEWGVRDPAENIAAVFDTWLEDRSAFFPGG